MYNIKILCKLIKNIAKFAYKNMVTIIIINEKKSMRVFKNKNLYRNE